MIKPITEEYFYELAGEDLQPWKIIRGFTYKEIPDSDEIYRFSEELKCPPRNYRWACTNDPIYIEKPGHGAGIYIESYKMILIPNKFSETFETSPDEEFDYSDWKYTKCDNQLGRNYTLNELSRTYDWCFLDKCKDRVKDIPNGNIEIFNKRVGYSKKIFVKVEIESWTDKIYIGYPEKIDLPVNITKTGKEDRFIKNVLLWIQKK